MKTARMSTRVGIAALSAVVLLAGCNDKITGDVSQIGKPAMDINMDPSLSHGVASGSETINAYLPVVMDTAAIAANPDAFKRAKDQNGYVGGYWEFYGFVRDSISDPRLPAMQMTPQRLAPSFSEVYGPEFYADLTVFPFEFYTRIYGFKPSTEYFISLARYGLHVNGLLDQAEMLVYGRITQPDSLYLIDPNPQGYPAVDYQWRTNAGCDTLEIIPGANPLYLGPQITNTGGRLTFDKCFHSGREYYHNHHTMQPDSTPFARNSFKPAVIPDQWNYLVISEGSTPGGPVVSRIQLAADENADKTVVPNAFAPFPTSALNPGVLVSRLHVARTGPTDVTMTVLPLQQLTAPATYKVMLVNREQGTATQVKALYYTITNDTTGKDENGNPIVVTTYSDTTVVDHIPGGASNVTHVLRVVDSLNTSAKVEDNTDFALQPDAAAPVGMPVFAHYASQNGTPNNRTDDTFWGGPGLDAGVTNMGSLFLQPNAVPIIFQPSGSGQGSNRGDQIGVQFQRLIRPPLGFYYNVWLVSNDSTVAPYSLGVLHTPLPEYKSLKDADILPSGGVLTPGMILQSNVLLRPADVAAIGVPLSKYQTIRLTLQAKDAPVVMPPVVVLEGPFNTLP